VATRKRRAAKRAGAVKRARDAELTADGGTSGIKSMVIFMEDGDILHHTDLKRNIIGITMESTDIIMDLDIMGMEVTDIMDITGMEVTDIMEDIMEGMEVTEDTDTVTEVGDINTDRILDGVGLKNEVGVGRSSLKVQPRLQTSNLTRGVNGKLINFLLYFPLSYQFFADTTFNWIFVFSIEMFLIHKYE